MNSNIHFLFFDYLFNRNLNSTDYMLGTILGALQVLNHWTLSTTLGDGSYSPPHFIHKETGTGRSCNLTRSHSKEEVELGFKARQSISKRGSLPRDNTHEQFWYTIGHAAVNGCSNWEIINFINSSTRTTPEDNSRTLDSEALPSLSGQMHPKLASLGFIGERKKGWPMGLWNKPN